MMCGKIIEGGVVGYPCSLDRDHDGPCFAVENARSVRERQKWEAAQAEPEKTPQEILAEFQGPAQTTAERYTVGATPVPGTVTEPMTEPVVAPDEDPRLRVTTSEDFLSPEDQQQPGDQPLPLIHDGESVQDRLIAKARAAANEKKLTVEEASSIIAMAEASKIAGVQRYGTPLQTFNGRNALQDLEDELRDAFIYVSSINQARESSREELIDAVLRALEARVGEAGLTAEDIAAISVDTILEATAAGIV